METIWAERLPHKIKNNGSYDPSDPLIFTVTIFWFHSFTRARTSPSPKGIITSLPPGLPISPSSPFCLSNRYKQGFLDISLNIAFCQSFRTLQAVWCALRCCGIIYAPGGTYPAPRSSRLRHRQSLPGRSPTCESRFSVSDPLQPAGCLSPEAVNPAAWLDTKIAPPIAQPGPAFSGLSIAFHATFFQSPFENGFIS